MAGGLAAELEERPWATLIPHVLPTPEPGLPPYSAGARLPRTPLGARRSGRSPGRCSSRGRAARPRGAERRPRPRRPAAARPRARRHLAPAGPDRHLPPARVPARRLAAVDAGHRAAAVGAALRRHRAAAGRRPARAGGAEHLPGPRAAHAPGGPRGPGRRAGAGAGHHQPPPAARARCRVPANAKLVDWLSYAKAMPRCAAVVCHAGHGTVVRALASGAPIVGCPAAGDMAENAARVAWAGAGHLAPPPPGHAPAACGWRCGSCCRTRATPRGPGSWRPGRPTTTARRPPRPPWRGSGRTAQAP